MDTVIPAAEPTSIPVVGGGAFPVRRIFCVGRNYAAHAREMGSDPDREPPFFFMKPADAVLLPGCSMPYPPATSNLHHEIELVLALRSGGRDITAEAAPDHIYGYAVGLDMTRRDLQNEAKKTGRPWDMAKGFDLSAPITPIHPATADFNPNRGAIWLDVNGTRRQQGDLADQIWSPSEVIAVLSRLVTLQPGDLIFTGTPDGVAAVERGDHLVGHIDGLTDLSVEIV
jgi:fumarylpyruvate hydrolase